MNQIPSEHICPCSTDIYIILRTTKSWIIWLFFRLHWCTKERARLRPSDTMWRKTDQGSWGLLLLLLLCFVFWNYLQWPMCIKHLVITGSGSRDVWCHNYEDSVVSQNSSLMPYGRRCGLIPCFHITFITTQVSRRSPFSQFYVFLFILFPDVQSKSII